VLATASSLLPHSQILIQQRTGAVRRCLLSPPSLLQYLPPASGETSSPPSRAPPASGETSSPPSRALAAAVALPQRCAASGGGDPAHSGGRGTELPPLTACAGHRSPPHVPAWSPPLPPLLLARAEEVRIWSNGQLLPCFFSPFSPFFPLRFAAVMNVSLP
jgi:hypothetical protein